MDKYRRSTRTSTSKYCSPVLVQVVPTTVRRDWCCTGTVPSLQVLYQVQVLYSTPLLIVHGSTFHVKRADVTSSTGYFCTSCSYGTLLCLRKSASRRNTGLLVFTQLGEARDVKCTVLVVQVREDSLRPFLHSVCTLYPVVHNKALLGVSQGRTSNRK